MKQSKPYQVCPSTASDKHNHKMLQWEINKLAYLIEDKNREDKFAGDYYKKGQFS